MPALHIMWIIYPVKRICLYRDNPLFFWNNVCNYVNLFETTYNLGSYNRVTFDYQH